ncbi:ATP-dependent Clp protease ATP-binding subunit [Ruminococcus sp. AM36-18]|nr:ATP-dependent Clp protease ATP-binding subunit [Ruminococcus sp. AM36-18]RGH59568.1 ATP-dependent Clp protease ATP-binding subunit [Ruminococcus sp. AM36-18]
MLCTRCGKRPAVVFVSNNNSKDAPTAGYCLTCAKELGIKPVEDLISKMGISDEDLENVQDQMNTLMNSMGDGDMSQLMEQLGADNLAEQMGDFSKDGDGSEDDDFSHGAPAFPAFFNSMFGGQNNNATNQDNNKKGKKEKKEKNRKHINLYCEDLTRKAREGKIDRIVGRDSEIERVIQILSRRTKNNPCLIGEPGVGKTAIAEGLALRIAAGNVPQRLKNKEIQLLDLTSLVAGTQFRGQFESRIKGLVSEIKENGNIILFIDEVHSLVGTGDNEGTMNAANILKPALSRGEVQVIGATTFNEYRKYIEKDSALERRFQPVKVGEPTIAQSIDVIAGVKGYYEAHHRVIVDDDIVRKTVVLSERYITDRFLPDKAIDLLDESCACAALRNKNMERHDKLEDERQKLIIRKDALTNADEVNYEQLAEVNTSLARIDSDLKEIDPETLVSKVTEEDIAKVIELWTGIPASRIKENELSELADLEDELKKKIIGQDEAVKALASAIRRSRVQISPRRRPASFIFVGPTGVGKTELVKVLSKELFDTPETLIRLDMSEFMEKHSVSKIIGSPPGYVGYDEAGQVTEKVRRRPYSVLLFDEIEKAHPDVLNILLQILDEGRVTDAHGRTVNFENTVIIMTSNAGSASKDSALGFGKTEEDASKEKVMKALSEFLRPEFIARVDEVIVFNSLKKDDFVKIADLMLSEYVPTLEEKHIKFTFDEKVCQLLAEQSCNGASGARDLRNTIRREVEEKIANAMIEAGAGGVTAMHLTAENGEPVLQSI